MCPHKFKMSLSFEYEGDDDEIKSMQAGVNHTLGTIAHLQNQMVDSKGGAEMAASSVFVDKPANSVPLDQKSLPKATRQRRSNGGGALTLLRGLKSEGYFTEKRTIGDVVAELARQGHTFQSNNISTPLKNLTKQKVLVRMQSAEGGWVYENGPKDE